MVRTLAGLNIPSSWPDGHHRPPPGPRTEWEYFGPYGVRFEGDHLLWYEREGAVRFASGGASEQTFADFWDRAGSHVTEWTNAMLQPLPEHVQQILGAAAGNETVARRFANGFSDPADFQHWFMDPTRAKEYLTSLA